MSASQFPPLQSRPSERHCTNCSAKMALYTLPGHYDSTVEIDVCMACNAIWFDQFESIQLSPDGTVALFQLIHEHGSTPTGTSSKLNEGLRCVTCGGGMQLTQDQVKGTRFSYQACRKGHGRFTTFYNFLAEKQFVRELTRAERAKLAATVQQVRCSGCGAAVNIGKVDACEYCRAPVSVFDRDAAKQAIDHYLLERQKQVPVRPGRISGSGGGSGGTYSSSGYDGSDLASDILFALGRAATRGLGGAGRAVPAAGASGAAGSAMADNTLETFPDATSALFGSGGGEAAVNAASSAASSLSEGLGSSVSETLPSATDALFGTVASSAGDAASGLTSEFAGALGDAASSGLGSVVDSVGEAASSAGEGVVDLVVDGIGSLLGALFD